MSSHDWSRFLLRVPIAASKQSIFDCWTSRSGLETWFLRKAEFSRGGKIIEPNARLEAGDNYEWMWHGWSDEVVERGTVLQSDNERFKFSFGKAGNVTVTVNNEHGQNILELVQDEIPTDENAQVNYHIGCTKGWLFYLVNLKSLLEGGHDLRNRNTELKDVVNS